MNASYLFYTWRTFCQFYFVLSPVSITMQLLGKDILDQKIDLQAASYWKKKTPPPNREQYEKLF